MFSYNDNPIITQEDVIKIVEETNNSVEKTLSIAGVVGSSYIELLLSNTNVYGTNYVINRCINMLAYNGSKVPMSVFCGDVLMPPDFKLSGGFSLQQPHPRMSLATLLYQCFVYYWYRGEFMAYIDEEDFLTLEPLNPKLMNIASSDEFGNIELWKLNYKREIPAQQLIYHAMMNPDKDILGATTINADGNYSRATSLVEVVLEEINNDIKAREYNTKFFANFGKVGGTLCDEKGEASPSVMKTLVKEFDSVHKSSKNAYKTLGLPRGIKYQEGTQTLKEMEFLQSRRDIRDRILSTFGIHKSIFGVTDQVDRAVAETARKQLWEDTLQPAARQIQEAFNQCLFKRYFPGYRCEFDFSNIEVLQKSQLDNAKIAEEYRKFGYTTNEINQKFDLGMEEVTEPVGDMRFVPTSLVSVDEITMSLEDDTPTKEIAGEDNINKLVSLVGSINKDKKDKDKKAKRNSRYRVKYNELHNSVDKKLVGKIGKYYATQLGKVLRSIDIKKFIVKTIDAETGEPIKDSKTGEFITHKVYKMNGATHITKDIDINTILAKIKNTLEKDKEVLSNKVKPIFEDGALKGSTLALNTLKSTVEPSIDDIIVSQMTNKIGRINNDTYNILRKVVKKAVEEGDSIDMLAKSIQRVYKVKSAHARTVARTESGALINRTTEAEYRKAGVRKKQWIGGTRPTHAAINGQIKNYDEVFDNNLLYPHDPNGPAGEVINCTCCLGPVIE